ncbi:hypothetical protein [Paenibacillus aquistagni]|uniref:Uncharacterized protein n=1 Tax=Paenibacillus aquistagni TaxID=1852522 RepID=A0A1X7KAJ4_9BACL|nr:hypothetical protein [Paenibacillus aquistagni]SMG38189.1 hypothetical protein SAMN06295960_2281 [Paenibacillus aquistagni]
MKKTYKEENGFLFLCESIGGNELKTLISNEKLNVWTDKNEIQADGKDKALINVEVLRYDDLKLTDYQGSLTIQIIGTDINHQVSLKKGSITFPFISSRSGNYKIIISLDNQTFEEISIVAVN